MGFLAASSLGCITSALTFSALFVQSVKFWPAVGYAWEMFTVTFLVTVMLSTVRRAL